MSGNIAPSDLIDALDRQRRKLGFLSIPALIALTERDNVILDPFSTLISIHADIGSGNVFYPATRLETPQPSMLAIGDENTFYTTTTFIAVDGPITIAHHNQFGDGTVTIATNRPGADIRIGSNGRFRGMIDLQGKCTLGDGCQILGNITARDIILGKGGSYHHPIADERGAVLKGHGQAMGIRLEAGQVIAGEGRFDAANRRMQSFYHPDAK